MAVKVICTCSKCILCWVIVDGQRMPGNKVSSQLRRRHEISDAVHRSPDFAPKPSTMGTKDLPIDDDDDASLSVSKPSESARSTYEDTPGKVVKTHSHPEGANVTARIVPLVAAIPAAREAGGFLSYAATMFCSFCLLTKDEQHRLDYWNWPKRIGSVVLKQARKWFQQPTKEKQILEERKTGVRILEHQLRVLWGIGCDARRTKALAELDAEDEDLWTDDDISEAGGEEKTREVVADKENFDPNEFAKWRENYIQATQSEEETMEEEDETHTPRGTPAPDLDDAMDGSTSEATPVPESLPPDEIDVDQDEQFEDVAVRGSWKFTAKQMETIHSCIRDVSLPTWVSRPPVNLGEKKHGKLKAEDFFILFSVIFPLVLPEIQFDEDPIRHDAMFKSFCHLVAATNILASFKTSNSAADTFLDHYYDYFASIQTLFPDVNTVPNHHYAMHNTDILKNWGPLTSQNEFMGEHINGMLQKTKTNDHLYDMDYTMLRQMARLGRLLARQHDNTLQDDRDPALKTLDSILDPEDTSKTGKPKELDEADLAAFLAKKEHEIPVEMYNLILGYLTSVGEHKLNFWGSRNPDGSVTLPDPDHRSMILPPRAKKCRQCHVDKRTYSCNSSNRGNSLIQFYKPGTDPKHNTNSTGVINTIFKIPLDGFLRTFILVHPHCSLNIQPQPRFDHPELLTVVVDTEPEPDLIVLEVATWGLLLDADENRSYHHI
ncbi:hypothetical protein C8R43DRAFT_948457 [Mycena crocata]|nr:hypothetical protein C8R43DRAFT_948457 [Mycena crocata]